MATRGEAKAALWEASAKDDAAREFITAFMADKGGVAAPAPEPVAVKEEPVKDEDLAVAVPALEKGDTYDKVVYTPKEVDPIAEELLP